jgi:hypothetical protein
MQCRLRQRLSFFGQQAVSVLDGNRRIVDQYAHCERKPAKCHGIERLTQKIQHDERA